MTDTAQPVKKAAAKKAAAKPTAEAATSAPEAEVAPDTLHTDSDAEHEAETLGGGDAGDAVGEPTASDGAAVVEPPTEASPEPPAPEAPSAPAEPAVPAQIVNVTIEQPKDAEAGTLEEWESLVEASYRIQRYGEKGERSSERIRGKGKVFFITADERRKNQVGVRDKKNDPFTNGAFRLNAHDASDAESVALADRLEPQTDEDLQDVLDSSLEAFTMKVNSFMSELTVTRLYRLARRQEIGGRKMKVVTKRLKAMNPQINVVGDQLGTNAESYGSQPDDAPVDIDGPSRPKQYAGMPEG